MINVLVPLAQGCEELEAVTIIDLLQRAEINVVTAGLDNQPVKASRGTVLVPDQTIDDVIEKEFDMIVLPGGQPGADNLEADTRIISLLQKMAKENKFTAAICAAPKVLATAGLLAGKHATSYPDVLENSSKNNIILDDDAVVKDGKVITSRGPGTAMDFALELIESLVGKQKRQSVESSLVRK